MARRILALILSLMIALSLLISFPKTAQAAPGSVPETAWDLMPALNVGWNLGNSLENQTLSEGYLPSQYFNAIETHHGNPVTTEALIKAIADAGFSSIRIPVSFYNHLTGSKPALNGVPRPGTVIDEKWLDRVQEVVDWALKYNLYVVINNHHDTGMWETMGWIHADADNLEAELLKYTNLWAQVAKRFQGYDNHLIFQSTGELVNSARSFTAYDSYRDFQAAHDFNQAFIDTVRAGEGYNKQRFLILETYAANAEPVFVDQCFYKPYTDPTASQKLIFGVHCYHTDPDELRAVFLGLAQKSIQYGMPFIVDECGTKYNVDPATRVEIARVLSEESARYGAAVMIWDDGEKEYALVDRKQTILTGTPTGHTSTVVNGVPYTLPSREIVTTLLYAKNKITPLTKEELRTLYDTRYQVTDFVGLDAAHTDLLKAGQYAQTHENAANPVSEYIPTPSHYAAIYPYVYAEGAHFLATLPAGVKVVVREHDKNGHYIGSVFVENGGYYLPSDNAFFLGISLRTEQESVTLNDYISMVRSGRIRLYQGGYDYSAFSVRLSDAVRNADNSITVTWEALQGADGYRVLRRESADGIWMPVGQLLDKNAVSFTDYGAATGQTYYYTVKPYVNRREPGMSFKLFGGYDKQGVRSR